MGWQAPIIDALDRGMPPQSFGQPQRIITMGAKLSIQMGMVHERPRRGAPVTL